MKLNLKRPFQTRDGKKVVIISENGSDIEFPVIGEVQLSDNGDWLVTKWDLNGICIAGPYLDLVNDVTTKTVVVGFIRDKNEEYALGAFDSIEQMTKYIASTPHRIGSLIGSAKVTLKEGEFVQDEGNSNI